MRRCEVMALLFGFGVGFTVGVWFIVIGLAV